MAESTSVSVPTGAISTGVCSVNAVVTLLPAPPAFRSTTGASFTAVPVMALTPVIAGATPSLTLVAMVKLLL